MANMKRIGFGQVEPNHLSAQRTGNIYAQLPANKDIKILENGRFVKYDYANGEVNTTGKGEWMLVFNEVKLYRGSVYYESYKDFAMIKEHYTPGTDELFEVTGVDREKHKYEQADEASVITHDGYGPFKGTMYPRVFQTQVGDIYTTNCLKAGNTDGKAELEMEDLEEGNILQPNKDGYLVKMVGDEITGMAWQVAKRYTMPDGQEAVKIQRIQ